MPAAWVRSTVPNARSTKPDRTTMDGNTVRTQSLPHAHHIQTHATDHGCEGAVGGSDADRPSMRSAVAMGKYTASRTEVSFGACRVCVFVTCRNGTASHGHMCMCVVARMSGVRLQSSGSSRSCVKYARDCLRRKRGAGCLTDPDLAHCLQPRGATLSCQRRDSFRARFALHVRRLPGRARGINGQP